MGSDEVRRRPDVVLVERGVGQPELGGHEERVRGLVELDAERVGRQLAVHEAVAGHGAVGQLLALEQEQGGGPGGGEVAVGHETGPRLVEIAGEHLTVGAEVGVVRVAGRDGLPPRRGQAGDDRTGEGLVLAGLEHVGVQVVAGVELLHALVRNAGELRGRRLQSSVVGLPARLVVLLYLLELDAEGSLGGADGLGLGGAEAERQDGLARPAARLTEVELGHLYDVAVAGRVVRRREGAVGVELRQAVAGGAHESARHLREGPVERREHGLGVVAVGRVRGSVGVGGDGDRMAGRGVGHRVVRAAVASTAAAVAVHRRVEPHIHLVLPGPHRRQLGAHEDGVPGRVSDVVGHELVGAALGRARDPADHAAGVKGGHRRRHVPVLQVGEGAAVGHDELQRLDVRVVDRRIRNVAQDTAGHRVPDLRRRSAGRADAILARQIEVRQRSRPTRRRPCRARTAYANQQCARRYPNAHHSPPHRNEPNTPNQFAQPRRAVAELAD